MSDDNFSDSGSAAENDSDMMKMNSRVAHHTPHRNKSQSYNHMQTPTPASKSKGKLGVRIRASNNISTPYHPPQSRTSSVHTNLRASTSHQSHTPMSLNEKLKRRREAVENEWQSRSRKDINTDAMQSNTKLNLRREPLLPDLTVTGDEDVSMSLKYSKFTPCRIVSQPKDSALALLRDRKFGRRLGARGRLSSGVIPSFINGDATGQDCAPAVPTGVEVQHDEAYEPLYLWKPTDEQVSEDATFTPIFVDEFLGKRLRPHQREGVQFMAECVLSLRSFQGSGCILADDMGLGKTCMSVSLLYTLLRHGYHFEQPICRRIIVVCPTSLVSNWKNEVYKWVGDQLYVIGLTDSDKKSVDRGIDDFLRPYPGQKKAHVLVLSYDTYRRRKAKFNKPDTCDLLVCDEAHRLKNADTAIYKALNGLPCKRRILLSGTPLQNDLSEFYAMVNFVNPNVLGDQHMFARYYENPILMGREPDAYDEERVLGASRSVELSAIVNQFVLRRTNMLLSQHLPPKVMQVVCCRPTPLQIKLYNHFSQSKAAKQAVNSDNAITGVLPLIDKFKKLCNHPKIIYDNEVKTDPTVAALFPSRFIQQPSLPEWSGKMHVLDVLLTNLKQRTDDRVVIVSNFTNTLDVIADICKLRQWAFLRLDGTTAVKKRQDLVDQLGDKLNSVFVFLLSSKAGGCGLNMIGANRLVLFDPDWNPAVDKQAAARVWRDGQTKRCFIYRFVTTGSIEEKIYQRQIAKEGLQGAIGGESVDSNVSMAELKDLFDLATETAVPLSDTHDTLECDCCNHILDRVNKRERKFRERKHKKGAQAAVTDGAINTKDSSDSEDDGGSDKDRHLGDKQADSDSGDDPSSPTTPVSGSAHSNPSSPHQNTSPTKSGVPVMADNNASCTDVGRQPRATWQSRAMIGQRGEPAEDELVNWGHHATVMSVPDPILRTTYNQLRIRDEDDTDEWPVKELRKLYISFVFSCEVRGKSLSVDDDMRAAKVSALCDLPPVSKKKAEADVTTMTAEEAQHRHEQWMNKRTKKDGTNNTGEDENGVVPKVDAVRQPKKVVPKSKLKANSDSDEVTMPDDKAPSMINVVPTSPTVSAAPPVLPALAGRPSKRSPAKFKPSKALLEQFGIAPSVWSKMGEAEKEAVMNVLLADIAVIEGDKDAAVSKQKQRKTSGMTQSKIQPVKRVPASKNDAVNVCSDSDITENSVLVMQ